MAFLRPDGSSFTVRTEDLIGLGQSGIVLRRGEHALKIPKARDPSHLVQEEQREHEYCLNEIACDILQNEIEVYKRVGRHRGIAECVEITQDGILLVYYRRGDAHQYISRNVELNWWKKRDWILSIIETVTHLHKSRVLTSDLALRNLLIADDLSLKMIDFGQCEVLPIESDPATANVDGLTAKVDMFHIGCLIYSVAAWCDFEKESVTTESEFPPLEALPEIDHLPCADIIRKCWTGQYENIEALRADAHHNFSIGFYDVSSFWLRRCGNFLSSLQLFLPGSL